MNMQLALAIANASEFMIRGRLNDFKKCMRSMNVHAAHFCVVPLLAVDFFSDPLMRLSSPRR